MTSPTAFVNEANLRAHAILANVAKTNNLPATDTDVMILRNQAILSNMLLEITRMLADKRPSDRNRVSIAPEWTTCPDCGHKSRMPHVTEPLRFEDL